MDIQSQIDELKSQISSISTSRDITRDTQTALTERLSGSFQTFPIGSVFTSAVATNPAILLGYGTWAAFGSGQVMVGYANGDPDFGTLGQTGGEKSHTLSVNEMPAHKHQPVGYTLAPVIFNVSTGDVGTAQGGSGTATNVTRGLPSEGGSAAHNNIQPYVVVYFWQRTA